MSSMRTNNQGGYVNATVISLIAVSVLLAGSLGFGTWAFLSRQDYKNNSDQKAEKAADERQKATEDADAIKYAEAAKNPLTTHKGSDQYGGVTVQYPKTWSGYVNESGTGSFPVDDYFHPAVVPDISNRDNSYALRIQVEDKKYDAVVKGYLNDVEQKRLTAAPYALPKVPNTVGTRLDGEIAQNKQGSLIILPVRNMTLKIWVESPSYAADFNNIILPNITFSP